MGEKKTTKKTTKKAAKKPVKKVEKKAVPPKVGPGMGAIVRRITCDIDRANHLCDEFGFLVLESDGDTYVVAADEIANKRYEAAL